MSDRFVCRFMVLVNNRTSRFCSVHRHAIEHAMREAVNDNVATVIDLGSEIPHVTFTADESDPLAHGKHWGKNGKVIIGLESHDSFARFVADAIDHGEASEVMDALASE